MPSLSRPIELSIPPVGLHGPRRRVARPRLLGDRLGQDSAQPRQIDQAGHFPGVAERARGHHDRIGQAQAAELNVEADIVGGHGRLGARGLGCVSSRAAGLASRARGDGQRPRRCRGNPQCSRRCPGGNRLSMESSRHRIESGGGFAELDAMAVSIDPAQGFAASGARRQTDGSPDSDDAAVGAIRVACGRAGRGTRSAPTSSKASRRFSDVKISSCVRRAGSPE